MSRRVLVIGLDGATFDILGPWVQEGRLPHLACLLAEGGSGTLLSTTPPSTAPAWVSFQTGKNPGKHGIIDFVAHKPGRYDATFVNATHVRGETLWSILSRHGRRVGLLNIPMTYPPSRVNGWLVSGMLTPSVETAFTYPEELEQELRSRCGDYHLPVMASLFQVKGFRGFMEEMSRVTRYRADVALYLMDRYPWDFFTVHFQSVDSLQHVLWSAIDPAHCEYQRRPPEERERVAGYYGELDRIVGKLCSQAGDETAVIILSDHGFGPALRRFYVNQWLREEGLLRTRVGAGRLRALGILESLAKRADILSLRKWLAVAQRERYKRVRARFSQERLIEWATTKVFATYGSHCASLYLNCRGREAQGIVGAGREYEELRERVAERLCALEDPETGQRVIEAVYRREEIYQGPYLERMPDLVAKPKGGYTIATRFRGDVLFEPMSDHLTGGHRAEGILIVKGKGLAKGKKIEGATIMDLAPTILYILGVPIPEDMDGRPLHQAFTREHLEEHEMEYEERRRVDGSVEGGYSKEEEEVVAERLRGLGYLE